MPQTPIRRTLDPEHASHPVRTALRDMREGFVYMVRTPWLLATLLFASLMILVMMGPLEVLIPFLVKDVLGGGPSDHSYVLAGFGIGGALGSLAMASVRMPRRYLTLMNLGWGAACLPFLLIGVTTQVWVVVACAFVMGALFSAPMVIWGTLLQRRVPPALLGRVASLDFFVSVSLMPVSMALAGAGVRAHRPVGHVRGRRHRPRHRGRRRHRLGPPSRRTSSPTPSRRPRDGSGHGVEPAAPVTPTRTEPRSGTTPRVRTCTSTPSPSRAPATRTRTRASWP